MAVYDEEKLNLVSEKAKLDFKPEEIALLLNIPKDAFLQDIAKNVDLQNAIKKGKLLAEEELRKNALSSSRAMGQYRQLRAEKSYKNALDSLFDISTPEKKNNNTSFAERLISYGNKEIVKFRKTGKSQIIKEDDQDRIQQLTYAAELFSRQQSIKNVAHKLCEMFPKLEYKTAEKRIYEAINYFHLNSHVANKAWDNFYTLELFPKLQQLALIKGDVELAFKISLECHRIQTSSEDLPDAEDLKPHVYIISASGEQLGIKKHNLLEIRKELFNMIDEFEIEKEEKERLIKETKQVTHVK